MIFHYSISNYDFTGSKSEVMTIQRMSYMYILKLNTYYIWNFRRKKKKLSLKIPTIFSRHKNTNKMSYQEIIITY
jgi:hypothetical protein